MKFFFDLMAVKGTRRVGCREDLLIPLPVLSESYALAC